MGNTWMRLWPCSQTRAAHLSPTPRKILQSLAWGVRLGCGAFGEILAALNLGRFSIEHGGKSGSGGINVHSHFQGCSQGGTDSLGINMAGGVERHSSGGICQVCPGTSRQERLKLLFGFVWNCASFLGLEYPLLSGERSTVFIPPQPDHLTLVQPQIRYITSSFGFLI